MHTEKVTTANGTFTAVFEKSENWYIVHVKELRGALTQGKTLRAARANIADAIDLIIEVNRDMQAEKAAKKAARENVARVSP